MDKEGKNNSNERSFEELWDACPNSCGCDYGCALDDRIFLESVLLDVYREKMRNEKREEGDYFTE
jgi:hypothetical protein